MKKTFALVTVACIALVGAIISYNYIFTKRQNILAEVNHLDVGDFLVLGKSVDLIAGWMISFSWRRPDGPWMMYYLDHETPLWRDVKVYVENNRVFVRKGSDQVGYLDLNTGVFDTSDFNNRVQSFPTEIVMDANPFAGYSGINRDSSDWKSVWPNAMLPQR